MEELENEGLFKDKKIGVYVKVDDDGNIVAVNSDIFEKNLDGWTKIDEWYGDNYVHAQTSYFKSSLIDEEGNFVYNISKLIEYKQKLENKKN